MTDRMILFGRVVLPWRAALLAALLSLAASVSLLALLTGARTPPASSSAAVRDGLASLPAAAQGPVSSALGGEAATYRVTAAPGGLQAHSVAQRLRARFGSSGVALSSGATSIGLGLEGIGYGGSLRPVEPVRPSAHANRVLYAHAQIGEWYANGPLGLEQGFTVPRAPAGGRTGALTLSLRLSGSAAATLAPGGAAVSFGAPGAAELRYGQLVAVDARGRTLSSSMQLRDGHLLLQVDDRGAAYPLGIDPLVQAAHPLKVESEDGAVGQGQLGYSVALSADGNTALVGAPADNSSTGAVWMFVRSNKQWTRQGPKLTAGEAGGGDSCGEAGGPGEEAQGCSFGRSVALSADGRTALIGGPRQSGPCATGQCTNQGAAWVFTRTGSSWTQQSTLTGGTEESAEGRFGRSVALSGDGKTALIGAPANSSGGGAAFVFAWDGSSWAQRAKLTGSGEQGQGYFGRSVALSADGATALVGGPGDNGFVGAAWMFENPGGKGWTQQGNKLLGSEEQGEARFGYSVALSQDATTALVGGRRDNEGDGAAWLFARPEGEGESWLQQGPKVTGAAKNSQAEFGYAVALSADGSSALIGAPHEGSGIGSASLFGRTSEGLVSDGSKLTSTEGRRGWFGTAVALSSEGKAALVGAPKDRGKAGTVYEFVDPATIPLVSGLSPATGPVAGGTSVTITGSRLADASKVEFGEVEASFTRNPDGSVTAIAPAHTAATVAVVVTTPEGSSQAGPVFTYVQPPSIGEVSPAEGPTSGGTTVTITGGHLSEATSVSFGSVPATSFTVGSARSITAVTPAEAAGTVTVTVTTAGGAGRSHYTFVAPAAGTGGSGAAAGASGASGGVGGVGGVGGGVLGFGPLCRASLLSRTLAVLGNARAAVKLSWRGAGTCAGTLKLSVRVKAGKRVRTRTIGTASFRIAGGKTRTVTVKLNRLGRSLLAARHGRLAASLVIVSVTGHTSSPRTASVRLAVQKKRTVKARGR